MKPEFSLDFFDTETDVLDPTKIRIKVEVCTPVNLTDEYLTELQSLYEDIALDKKKVQRICEEIKKSFDKTQPEPDAARSICMPTEVKRVPLRLGKEFSDTRIHYEWFRKQVGYIAIYDFLHRKEPVNEEDKVEMANKVFLNISQTKALIVFNEEDINFDKEVTNAFVYCYKLPKNESTRKKASLIREALERITESVVQGAYDILNMNMVSESFKMRMEEEEEEDEDEDSEVLLNHRGRFLKWKLDHCMTAQEHGLAEKIVERARVECEVNRDFRWLASINSIQAAIVYKNFLKTNSKEALNSAMECIKSATTTYRSENLIDLYIEGAIKLLKIYKEHHLLEQAFALLRVVDTELGSELNERVYLRLYDFLACYAKSIGASRKMVYYSYKYAKKAVEAKEARFNYIARALEGLEVDLDIEKTIIKNYHDALLTIKMLKESGCKVLTDSIAEKREGRRMSVDYISYFDSSDAVIKSNLEEPPWPNLFLMLVDTIFKDKLTNSISLPL